MDEQGRAGGDGDERDDAVRRDQAADEALDHTARRGVVRAAPTDGEERDDQAGDGYLGLAVGHAIVLDAPPRALFETATHPAAATAETAE